MALMPHELESGRTADRNNNVNGCKTHVRDWIEFVPPIPIQKQDRGFKCESTGRYLCPVMYNYEDRA